MQDQKIYVIIMNTIQIGKQREKEAFKYLQKNYDKVIWASREQWHSPYDFIVFEGKVKKYVEVKSSAQITDIKLNRLLKITNQKNIIILVWKEGCFIERNIQDIPINRKLVATKSKKYRTTGVKILLEVSDDKIINKLEKICKNHNFYFNYGGQSMPNYKKAAMYLLKKGELKK